MPEPPKSLPLKRPTAQPSDGQIRTRRLSPAARRALAEAEQRRKSHKQNSSPASGGKEIGGTSGPEPTRYGDWEKGGIVSDF